MSLALAFVRGPGGRVDAYAQLPFALRTDRKCCPDPRIGPRCRAGWYLITCEPPNHDFALNHSGGRLRFELRLTAYRRQRRGVLAARAGVVN
jgi:hypothetical protein